MTETFVIFSSSPVCPFPFPPLPPLHGYTKLSFNKTLRFLASYFTAVTDKPDQPPAQRGLRART